eukprot:318787_1
MSFLKRKLIKTHETNDFIVKHTQKNKINDLIDAQSLDTRRVVFVSLLGIYSTWQKCPSFVLFSAILILPLKKKHIYSPQKHINEFQSIFSDVNNLQVERFLEMLRWKDSQGLIVWMSDDYNESEYKNDIIHPFWYVLSNKLANLYDPITGCKYNKLNLNAKWYQNKEKFKSKFNVKTSTILVELYFACLKFKSVSEILYQSNPQSLNPIQFYESNVLNTSFKEEWNKVTFESDDEMNGDWILSSEYDPHS